MFEARIASVEAGIGARRRRYIPASSFASASVKSMAMDTPLRLKPLTAMQMAMEGRMPVTTVATE